MKEGFVRAWRVGAQEWSQAEAAGQGGFYPVREAWKLYEPVGFVEGGIAVSIPSPERIVDGYRKEMRLFLDAAVGPRVAEALASEKAAGRSADQAANRVGILYAQFGLLDKAEEQFRAAAKRGGYAPALTNLGNALYLKGDMKGAYEQYARALALAPDSAVSLSGAARSLYALQDYEKMNKALDRLRVVSPELAAKIDLQGGAVTTARASEAVSREVDAWDE